MGGDAFAQQIQAAHQRARELYQRVGEPLRQETELLTNFLEELHTALTELQVADEELSQQNEELAAAHQVVEAERQRYQDLFEFAPDGYLVTDMNGVIQEANRAAALLLNIPQQSLTGKPLVVFVAQDERRAFRSELIRLHQVSRAEWETHLQPRSSQGKSGTHPCFDATLTAETILTLEGKPVALRWLVHDITAHKQAEAALLQAELAEAAKQQLEKEIIERKRIEEELWQHAFHDPLTGLPNRALFMDRLRHAFDYAKRHEDYWFAVLFLDLDRFKVINDSLGHALGDQLLLTVAGKLQAFLRPTDTVGRLGGDEFTLLLEGLKDASDVIRISQRIQAELALPLNLNGQEVLTAASIGIAFSSTGYDQPEDLLRDADTAMYRAKAQGPGRYQIFNPTLHAQAVSHLLVETELRRAVEQQELRVHYQPIASLVTGRISGFEALVRWQHPDRGLIPPVDFLPVAAETGLSCRIDQRVLQEACRQIRQWQAQFPANPPLTISVNLGSQQFRQPKLSNHIKQTLQETGLDASSLKLEITESVMMENHQSTALLLQLQALGIELCTDDFGIGYSSLSRLYSLPIHVLKIDRSFVSRMGVDQRNEPKAGTPIVEAIMTLAQKLGLAVIAEGVETAEQLAQLRALGCDYGQGYFFSRPLDAAAAEALMRTKPQW